MHEYVMKNRSLNRHEQMARSSLGIAIRRESRIVGARGCARKKYDSPDEL